MHWPTFPDCAAAAALPDGVTLRAWTPAELDALPARLVEWSPSITVGAESAFLDARFLHTHVATAEAPDRDLFAFAICRDDVVVGFQAFQRDRGARALRGRLGVLAPEARSGFLGALGFILRGLVPGFDRDLRQPFGGMKNSGVGREGGNLSREFFTTTRFASFPLTPRK